MKDVVEGKYYTQEGFKSNYLITSRGEKVSRVNVLGTVMMKFITEDENYGFLVVDDETETIRAKFFQDLGLLESVEEGEIVRVIGKIREYDGEIYINPEIVKPVQNPNHLTLWMAELADKLGELNSAKEDIRQMKEEDPEGFKEQAIDKYGEERVEAVLNLDPSTTTEADGDEADEEFAKLKEDILNIIEEQDSGEGTAYQDITDNVDVDEQKVDEVINDLLTEGTCFEPRPGKIKKL